MLQILYHTFRFAIVIRAVPRAMLLYEPLRSGDGVLEPPQWRLPSVPSGRAIAFGAIREGDCKDATREGDCAKVPSGRAIEGTIREGDCKDASKGGRLKVPLGRRSPLAVMLCYSASSHPFIVSTGEANPARAHSFRWINCFELRQMSPTVSHELAQMASLVILSNRLLTHSTCITTKVLTRERSLSHSSS